MSGTLARFGAAALAAASIAGSPAMGQVTLIAPLVAGDESIAMTLHRVRTAAGPLAYAVRAGRLPIRNGDTGAVRGYIFFTAYVARPGGKGAARPLTFFWNGGPTTSSLLVHTEMFGPRRLTEAGMVDNEETLLSTSDLVFMDPVGTGFSRGVEGSDGEFLSTLGDFAATAEFVRAWRARFGAEDQPLFLGGESYGTWRVNGTVELLEKRGIKVAGALLISGGVPGSLMPPAFQDAMYIQARTAAAFELGKLPLDLMQDKGATMRAVDDWAANIYMPALARVATLDEPEREAIARDLARFTGVRPGQIDRKTLVMTNNAYKAGLFDGDKARELNTYDMRIFGAEPEIAGREHILGAYLRRELGYATDLAYLDLEEGYMPVPGPERQETGMRWSYNHVELTPAVVARMEDGGGPPLSQPWLQNAMRRDPDIRVFVAAGRYDSLNMCEGNLRMSAKLEPALSRRFTHACYEGGHMMYRDGATRLRMAEDIARFIAGGAK